MPAANSIAVHDTKLNSGSASSGPSLMLPKRLAAISTMKIRKVVIAST